MRNTKLRISLREVVYIIAAILLFFEIYLMDIGGLKIIRYFDEAIAVFCLITILFSAVLMRLDRSQVRMLLLMVLVLAIGLVSTYRANLQYLPKAIFTDVGNTFKVFVTYIGATLYLKPVKDKKRIITCLATIMRLFVVVLFVCMLLHFSGIYRMGNDTRYGLPSFQFLNYGAGQLSLMFYSIFLVLAVDMRYDRHNRQVKMLFMLLAAIVWVSTLRTRAFLYIIMFFGLYWLLIKRNYEIKMNWKTVLIGIVFMLIFSLDQIEVYFGNDKAARHVFLEYGFTTMYLFFPFGSGFASYGTDAAVIYYSLLYYLYGFDSVWGLSPTNSIFAHDTYWPAIMAQFGAFGLIIMLLVVYHWARDLLRRVKHEKYAYLAGLFIAITQISSSIATATFFHFVTVGLFFLLPILFDDNTKKQEGGIPDETSDRLYSYI